VPPERSRSSIQSFQSGGADSRTADAPSGRPSSPDARTRRSSTISGRHAVGLQPAHHADLRAVAQRLVAARVRLGHEARPEQRDTDHDTSTSSGGGVMGRAA
jgi:hypothetical protein